MFYDHSSTIKPSWKILQSLFHWLFILLVLIWNRNSRHDLEFKTNPRIYTVPKCLYLGKRTNITYTRPFTLVQQLKSFHMSLHWEEVSVFTVVTDVFQGVNQAQTQSVELSFHTFSAHLLNPWIKLVPS